MAATAKRQRTQNRSLILKSCISVRDMAEDLPEKAEVNSLN
jgi:hypothetical protein